MTTQSSDDTAQATFQKLKSSCVPLLSHSILTPTTIPAVLSLLDEIAVVLRETQSDHGFLKVSLISYVFFPISTILQRNTSLAIPDHIMERILAIIAILSNSWWWDMDERTWEQIFMLSSAIVGGLESNGKAKERDDETKTAAVQCLRALLSNRMPESGMHDTPKYAHAREVLNRFRNHAQSEKFTPIVGQSIHGLLGAATSTHRPLQRASLDVLGAIVNHYIHDDFAPSVLPGVTSTMCKVALGNDVSRGWANGDIVASALSVMKNIIILSIGDDICLTDGAVKAVDDLENLTDLFTDAASASPSGASSSRYRIKRTPSWLNGTTSQLHIALNSLQPLVTHPTPDAQVALATFASAVLGATTLTLTQSQPLLLSHLLSLSVCDFTNVSSHAKRCLQSVLSEPKRHNFLHVLLQISKDNLIALPRLLSNHSELKLKHTARIIEAVCAFACSESPAAATISTGIGSLLGPNGGVERWGWNLLFVLEFTISTVTPPTASAGHLLLDGDNSNAAAITFPELTLRHLTSHSTHISFQRMLQALGSAAGESCIYSIEWFVGIGRSGRDSQSVAALWCATRLLEGAAHVTLGSTYSFSSSRPRRSKRLERLARSLAKTVAETWDDQPEDQTPQKPANHADTLEISSVEHIVGLLPVKGSVGLHASLPSFGMKPSSSQPLLHQIIMLQLLSVTSAILEIRFIGTLLYTLYPILHSLTSDIQHLVTTALAALQFVATATSYATPANLLLSNFDYALDAASRRLNRRWLDISATNVLIMLVQLVGRDVVQRASDVVEECFDRLDEYHGYEPLVDGLISVLAEVVGVVAANSEAEVPPERKQAPKSDAIEPMSRFSEWFVRREKELHRTTEVENQRENFGSVPQEAWSSKLPENRVSGEPSDPLDEPPSTPTQLLVQQIVMKSVYFLTHDSRLIRARILTLLTSASAVLPASLILPSVHHAWPFVLNRVADSEPFVVSAAATLVETLATRFGDFMFRRVWDDIWPRFRELLKKLEVGDSTNALARRGSGAVGTESAYTRSHRLYKSLLRTMTAALQGVQVQDGAVWEVTVMFRRFLHKEAHEELQSYARQLYQAISRQNEDAVWFVLTATQGEVGCWVYLQETRWDIGRNAEIILQH